MLFLKRWAKLIEEAKVKDEKMKTETGGGQGFGGLGPFIAIVFGPIILLLKKDEA